MASSKRLKDCCISWSCSADDTKQDSILAHPSMQVLSTAQGKRFKASLFTLPRIWSQIQVRREIGICSVCRYNQCATRGLRLYMTALHAQSGCVCAIPRTVMRSSTAGHPNKLIQAGVHGTTCQCCAPAKYRVIDCLGFGNTAASISALQGIQMLGRFRPALRVPMNFCL